MPDKIKDAYSAVKSTGLFIDEADFRAQIAKDKKAVFELFNSEKSTKGLFIDEADFDAQLGLGKQPASPSGNGGASSSAQSTPPVTPSTPSGASDPTQQEIDRLQAKYENALKTNSNWLTDEENQKLISLKKQKQGGGEVIEEKYKFQVAPFATSKQEAESQQFKEKEQAFMQGVAERTATNRAETYRMNAPNANTSLNLAELETRLSKETAKVPEGTTSVDLIGLKNEIEGKYGLLESDYLAFLESADKARYDNYTSRLSTIKEKGEATTDDQKFLREFRNEALNIRLQADKQKVDQIKRQTDLPAYQVQSDLIREEAKKLNAEYKSYFNEDGTPKSPLAQEKANAVLNRINALGERQKLVQEKTGVTDEVIAELDTAYDSLAQGEVLQKGWDVFADLTAEERKNKEDEAIRKQVAETGSPLAKSALMLMSFTDAIGSGVVSMIETPKVIADALGYGAEAGWTDYLYDVSRDLNNKAAGRLTPLESESALMNIGDVFAKGAGNVVLFASGAEAVGAIKAGSAIMKNAGVVTSAFLMSEGQNYREALAAGISPQDAALYATMISTAQALTETLVPDFKYFDAGTRKSIIAAIKEGKGVKEAFKQYGKQLLVDVPKTGVKEVGEELVTEVTGDAIKEGINAYKDATIYKDTFNPEAYANVALTAFVTGGGLASLKRGVRELTPNEESVARMVGENADNIVENIVTTQPEEGVKIGEDVASLKEIVTGLKKIPSYEKLGEREKDFVVNKLMQKRDLEESMRMVGVRDDATKAEIEKIESDINAVYNGKKVGEEYSIEDAPEKLNVGDTVVFGKPEQNIVEEVTPQESAPLPTSTKEDKYDENTKAGINQEKEFLQRGIERDTKELEKYNKSSFLYKIASSKKYISELKARKAQSEARLEQLNTNPAQYFADRAREEASLEGEESKQSASYYEYVSERIAEQDKIAANKPAPVQQKPVEQAPDTAKEKPKAPEKVKTFEEQKAKLDKKRKAELDKPKQYTSSYAATSDIDKVNDYKFDQTTGELYIGVRYSETSAQYSGVNTIHIIDSEVKRIEQEKGKEAAVEYIKEGLRKDEKTRVDNIESNYRIELAALETEKAYNDAMAALESLKNEGDNKTEKATEQKPVEEAPIVESTQEGIKEGAVEEIVPDKVQEGAAKVENVKDTFENREAIEDNLKDLGDNVYYHGSDDISYMNSKEDVNTAANTKNAESKYLNLSPKASVAISYSIRQQKIGDKSGVAAFKLTGNGYVMKNADIKMLKSNEDYEAFYDKKKLEGYDYIKVLQDANDIVVLNNNAIEYVGKKLNKEALEPLSEITQSVEQMEQPQEDVGQDVEVTVENNDVIKQNKIEGGFLDEQQSAELQKEIESKYNMDGPKFGPENEDIRTNIYNYDTPLAEKNVNGVNLRIAEGLLEKDKSGKKRSTYLLYADGKIVGKFYSVDDIKKVVKFIEDNLIKGIGEGKAIEQPQEDVGEGVGINNLKVIDGYIFELDKDNSIGNEKVFKINDGNGNNLGKIYIVDKSGAYYIENVKLNKERTGVGYDVYKKLIATLDKPIRSGEVQNEKAKGLWDKLVKEGLAKKEGDGYVSLKPKAVEQSLQASVGEEATKQQIENFGVNKADVEPVHSVISQVFNGLKKAGLTAAKTVGDWVGIGKGSEKPYSLKINGKDVQVKNTSPDVVNGFYSPLEAIINSVKQDKMPAKQWAEKFAKGEEAKWTGLADWLAQQEGSVSKADIQQFLKDNRIEIVEVVKGAGATMSKSDARKVFEDKGYDVITDRNGDTYVEKDEEPFEYDDMSEAEQNAFDVLTSSNLDRVNTSNDTKFSQYQLEGEKENYKEVLVTLPSKNPLQQKVLELEKIYENDGSNYNRSELEDAKKELEKSKTTSFRSTHFDEPNILVHLRMNTRTDAQGKKVLFLEEVQSDWGQEGKKEGFETKLSEKQKKINEWFKTGAVDGVIVESIFKAANLIGASQSEMRESSKTKLTPTAPFVMDTNAWTKLGLKVALKEAVAQGVDKIAWTTGEQQNERYDLSKQVNKIDIEAVEDEDNLFLVDISLANGAIENLEVENGIIREGNYGGQRLDNVVGKDYADKIMSTPKGESKTLEGADLKVGGKGMKGFYGSPTEGSLGIVGNIAKSLFKQEPKTTEIVVRKKDFEGYDINQNEDGTYNVGIKNEDLYGDPNNGFKTKEEAKKFAEKRIKEIKQENPSLTTTQHSIDITPELKASVEGGQPLFKDAEAQYRIESGKNIVEAIKDFNGSPRATIALTHEIMHPTVVAIIDGAKEGNEVGLKHTQTIVDEFNKANPKNQVTVEQLIEGNDAFKDGTTSKKYRAVQEFIAKSWEKYHLEGKQGFSKAFQDVLDQITKAFQSVYKSLSGKQLTPELRKMFDEILGKETTQAQEAETQIESIVSEALSELNIVKEQTPAKKQKKESKTAARKRFREATLGFEPRDVNKAVETFIRQYFSGGGKVDTESLIRELGLRGRNRELRGKIGLHKRGAVNIERMSEDIYWRLTEEQQEMIWQPDIRGIIIDILHSESKRDMRANLEEDYLAETDADMMGMTPQQYQDYKRHERDAAEFYEAQKFEEEREAQEAYEALFSPEVIDALMDIDEMSIEEIEAKYGDAIDADGNIDEVKLNELISNEQGTKNQEGTKENISKEGGRENQKPATEEVAILEVFDTIENAQRTKKTVKGKKEAMEEAVKEYGEVGEKAIFVESNFKDIIESLKEVKDAKGNNILKVKC